MFRYLWSILQEFYKSLKRWQTPMQNFTSEASHFISGTKTWIKSSFVKDSLAFIKPGTKSRHERRGQGETRCIESKIRNLLSMAFHTFCQVNGVDRASGRLTFLWHFFFMHFCLIEGKENRPFFLFTNMNLRNL